MGNQNDRNMQVIDAIPRACCQRLSLYISNANVQSSDITCSICFTIFSTPRILKCKHIICEDCIRQWGKSNQASCPFCRAQLKRSRGNFGRIDKKIQKKIENAFLKCRNCFWTGSYCQFINTFTEKPYLDDDILPGQTVLGDADEKEQQKVEEKVEEGQIIEQKKEIEEIEMTAHKIQLKEIQQDDVVQVKGRGKNKGYELFIEQLFKMGQDEPFEEEQFEEDPLDLGDINGPPQDYLDL